MKRNEELDDYNTNLEQLEVSKEHIYKMEDEIKEKYYELGKCIYESSERKITEINELVDEIIEYKKDILHANKIEK